VLNCVPPDQTKARRTTQITLASILDHKLTMQGRFLGDLEGVTNQTAS
jgi:hypothetical protein